MKSFPRFLCIMVMLATCASLAPAQIPWQAHDPVHLPPNEAGLLVWVTDPSGAVVQNAHVTIVNVGTHATIDGVTDMYGVFKARGLQAETYTVKAFSPGFRETQTTLDLTLGLLKETGVKLNSVQPTVLFVDHNHFPVQIEPSHLGVDASSVISQRTLNWVPVDPLPPDSRRQIRDRK